MLKGPIYTHILWGGKYQFERFGNHYRMTIIEYSTQLRPISQQDMGWRTGQTFDLDDFNHYFKEITEADQNGQA